MRRTIALTITAALALALAPFGVAQASHAFGHEEIVVTVTKPAGGSVAGTVDVAVTITENYGGDNPLSRGIASYKVELKGAGGFSTTFCEETFVNGEGEPAPRQGAVGLAFKWNTNRYPTGAPATNCDGGNPTLPGGGAGLPNGSYAIVATATMSPTVQGETHSDSDSVNVDVSNAPATPTGVKLKDQESADKITVSWNANPESGYDSVAYRVDECTVDRSSKPCSSWDTVDSIFETSLTVKRTKPGIYRYRVIALRSDADGTGVIASAGAATPQSDPIEIVVEEDPDPTTSTTEPDGDDDGTSTTVEPETRTVVKPTRRVQRAAPQVLQRIVEEDSGYEDELPYDDDEEAISGLPIDGNNEDGDGQMSMLVPLAGGLTLLIFALQLWYLNHRAGRALEPVPVEAYGPGEDWDG